MEGLRRLWNFVKFLQAFALPEFSHVSSRGLWAYVLSIECVFVGLALPLGIADMVVCKPLREASSVLAALAYSSNLL